MWGGDPTTGWDFDGLTSSVRQGLTMGTSGVSVWGPDIGGFMTLPGDPQQTPELLNRWIEYGAFTGVMRLQSGGISRRAPATGRRSPTRRWRRSGSATPVCARCSTRTSRGSQDAYRQAACR